MILWLWIVSLSHQLTSPGAKLVKIWPKILTNWEKTRNFYCKKPPEVICMLWISFFLCPIFIEYYSCLVRCLHFIKWLPTAGACPDQVEHVMVGSHLSLLVKEKVTPKWTALWLSQLFDSFNVRQWCPACYSKLETWWILLLFYWRSNMFLSQDTSRHCTYGNFGDKNHRFCLLAKQWGVRQLSQAHRLWHWHLTKQMKGFRSNGTPGIMINRGALSLA